MNEFFVFGHCCQLKPFGKATRLIVGAMDPLLTDKDTESAVERAKQTEQRSFRKHISVIVAFSMLLFFKPSDPVLVDYIVRNKWFTTADVKRTKKMEKNLERAAFTFSVLFFS